MKLTDEDINSIIGDINTGAPAQPHHSEVRVMFAGKMQELRDRCDTREEFLLAVATEFKNIRPMIEPQYRADPKNPEYSFMLEAFDLYDSHYNED